MFSFLKRHKNGILGTLLFHVVVLNIFFIIRLSTTEDLESGEILIDFEDKSVDFDKKVNEAINKEVIISKNINYTNYAKSLAELKKAEEKLYKDKGNNVNNKANDEYKNKVIKDALGESEYKKYQDLMKDKNKPTNKEKFNEESDPVKSNQNIVKDGPSTLVYELTNPSRYGIDLKTPVYQCQEGGTVMLLIKVDRKGKVISVILDESKEVSSSCLNLAAIEAAKNSTFNANPDAPEVQIGKIIYTFIPQ